MAAILPSENLKPEIKLTTAEKRAVFDWSPKRRQDVIHSSKTLLSHFLAKERFDGRPIDKTIASTVSDLWGKVVGCFQGNGSQTPLLVVNDQLITPFKPNILPTHSEYHVAKVLTLSTRLFNKALPESMQTQENALAVSLATIVHDVGSLLQGEEAGPQEKMYKFHELRAIALVDKIVDSLYRNDKGDHQQLKNKIKMLIAATVPKWNLDFSGQGTTICKLLDPRVSPPVTYDQMMKDLGLNPNEADDQETVLMKKNLRPQVDKLFMIFRGLRLTGDENALGEVRKLTHLMGAADHGAYMLEPAHLAEVMGLWQEQLTEWMGKNDHLTHRDFTPGAETSYTWLTSKFTETQWKEYQSELRLLGTNPFVVDQNITRSKEIAEHTRSILRDEVHKPNQDALTRVEGALSPVELANVATTDGLGLQGDLDIKQAIITFSRDFSRRFAEAHDFDKLSTKVLRLMYDKTNDKTLLFKTIFEVMIGNPEAEAKKRPLAEGGTMNIHLAPFAYLENQSDIGLFTNMISKAYEDLDPKRKKQIGKIFFTLREGADTVESFKSLILRFQASSDPPFGFALGGNPEDPRIIYNLMNTAGKDIDTVVHFGLEKKYEVMEKRLNSLLSYIKETGLSEELLKHISIHIDDGYEHFNRYYRNPNLDPDYKQYLQQLVKSVSPLGYLLEKGKDGFDQYMEFSSNFKGAIPGSNNACMMGGNGIAVQNLVTKLFSE